MKCSVCGTSLTAVCTDLPFKATETSIVIVKNLPLLQCGNCPQYLLEDSVLGRVDEILSQADHAAELEIIGYAA